MFASHRRSRNWKGEYPFSIKFRMTRTLWIPLCWLVVHWLTLQWSWTSQYHAQRLLWADSMTYHCHSSWPVTRQSSCPAGHSGAKSCTQLSHWGSTWPASSSQFALTLRFLVQTWTKPHCLSPSSIIIGIDSIIRHIKSKRAESYSSPLIRFWLFWNKFWHMIKCSLAHIRIVPFGSNLKPRAWAAKNNFISGLMPSFGKGMSSQI